MLVEKARRSKLERGETLRIEFVVVWRKTDVLSFATVRSSFHAIFYENKTDDQRCRNHKSEKNIFTAVFTKEEINFMKKL